MFSTYCPHCGTDVLLSYGRLRSLANTDNGIELRFTCWCGTELAELTGTKIAA